MATAGEDGVLLRDHLSLSAARGSAESMAQLTEPPCPPAVRYLAEWAQQLCGRSGVGMNGVAPLTFTTIRHWRKEVGLSPLSPFEVNGLLLLDAVMRHPKEAPPDKEAAGGGAPSTPWPIKKAPVSDG